MFNTRSRDEVVYFDVVFAYICSEIVKSRRRYVFLDLFHRINRPITPIIKISSLLNTCLRKVCHLGHRPDCQGAFRAQKFGDLRRGV